jgi:hypothetical protein
MRETPAKVAPPNMLPPITHFQSGHQLLLVHDVAHFNGGGSR